MHKFSQHVQERNLVSIYREAIDANSIEGYILGASDKLIVLQYVYDFNLDGLVVLRIEDISEVRRSKTSIFQQALLAKEGVEQRVPFGASFNAESWRSIVTQLAQQYPIMILECESEEEPDFVIGRVDKTTVEEVHIQGFSGVAEWHDTPTKLPLTQLTSCQVDTNHINFYQRHFERTEFH